MRRRAGAAAATSVLLASGALAAGAVFGARDLVAAPATPYASSVWSRLSLDGSVYGSPVNETLRAIEVSGNGNDSWNTLPESPYLTSATATGEVNVVTDPESAMTNANGAFTNLTVPDSGIPWVSQLLDQGTPSGGGSTVL